MGPLVPKVHVVNLDLRDYLELKAPRENQDGEETKVQVDHKYGQITPGWYESQPH